MGGGGCDRPRLHDGKTDRREPNMLTLIEDDAKTIDYTPIINAFTEMLEDRRGFARFLAMYFCDPYDIADNFDGDTPAERRELAATAIETLLCCPEGIEPVAEIIRGQFECFSTQSN